MQPARSSIVILEVSISEVANDVFPFLTCDTKCHQTTSSGTDNVYVSITDDVECPLRHLNSQIYYIFMYIHTSTFQSFRKTDNGQTSNFNHMYDYDYMIHRGIRKLPRFLRLADLSQVLELLVRTTGLLSILSLSGSQVRCGFIPVTILAPKKPDTKCNTGLNIPSHMVTYENLVAHHVWSHVPHNTT